MNDDDYWQGLIKEIVYGKTYTWSSSVPDYMNSKDFYDLIKHVRTGNDMPYYDRYGYSNTRDGEVAKAALEALEKGIDLTQLLEKNSKVRAWYGQLISDRNAAAVKAEREKERKRKAAEKKAIEDAKRAEAASKLTPEELEAFGLNKKGYHKR